MTIPTWNRDNVLAQSVATRAAWDDYFAANPPDLTSATFIALSSVMLTNAAMVAAHFGATLVQTGGTPCPPK